MRQVPKDSVLCLDIGNSHIVGGVFTDDALQFCFRYEVSSGGTSDQIGIFLRSVLRENGVMPDEVSNVAICSVVPHLDYSVQAACKKYFNNDPFLLQPGVKTGIKIKYKNPLEVGADVIASSVAGAIRYPGKNLIIVDFGTATTICPITKNREFLGGVIIPGMRLCMEALQDKTAKLPTVNIVKPKKFLGCSTVESIQSGLYYGQLASVRAVVDGLSSEVFAQEAPIVIGTGGFAHLFAEEKVFTDVVPNIVLEGLYLISRSN